jgi:hypothetical protein
MPRKKSRLQTGEGTYYGQAHALTGSISDQNLGADPRTDSHSREG